MLPIAFYQYFAHTRSSLRPVNKLPSRTSSYKPWLFAFSVFAALWTIGLLYAGAWTTSIQAGMAFLDWPLSNSSVNPDGWLQDREMLAEHSHRLLGAKLGLLTILLVLWNHLREARKPIRRLAVAILLMVIAQGVLGGMRVLFDQLNTGWDKNTVAQTFAVLHACGAQVTVCLLVSMALAQSRCWIERKAGLVATPSPAMLLWGKVAVGLIFVQILLGAVMRHAHAGLAIPTFPLTPEGGLLPAVWTFEIAVHWLHRAGAVIATLAIVGFATSLWSSPATRSAFRPLIVLLLAILGVQIFLGAATIWTYKNPIMASSHMVVGAALLATTWLLTLRIHKYVLETALEPLLPTSAAFDPVPTSSNAS